MCPFYVRLVRLLSVVAALTLCLALSAKESQAQETEVPVIKKIGSRYFNCFRAENAVYDEERYQKLIADKDCSHPKLLKVDFQKQTLIGFDIGGDCFIRGAARVFRNDETKKYNVRIKNIWGGCRAGGSFQGWLVVEKIPPDYTVDFTVMRVDGRREKDDDFLNFELLKENEIVSSPEILETQPIDLKGCIQTYFQKRFVIKDNEAFLKAIRNDMGREYCLKNLEKIDFGKHTLLGIQINSGYCRIPLGLTYKTVKDAAKKQYLFSYSYIDPGGAICRHVSRYDLWVLVPKLPDGYNVIFQAAALQKKREN